MEHVTSEIIKKEDNSKAHKNQYVDGWKLTLFIADHSEISYISDDKKDNSKAH